MSTVSGSPHSKARQGRRKKGKKQSPSSTTINSNGLHFGWFIGVIAILAIGFFSLSRWWRTPDQLTIERASHLRPRVRVERHPQDERPQVRGFSVSY